ncbi:MAG: glycerophosphodiester phosphodiesterase [Microthrixaceae bacterium]
MKKQIVDICAHRGASWNQPENTAAAFLAAKEEGADWVELDVRLNRSGDLIVHHDAAFTDGRGVWATPSDATPSGVLRLSEALDACVGMGVNIEIKNSPGDLGDAEIAGDGGVPHDLVVADMVVELVASRCSNELDGASEVTSRMTGSAVQPILVSSFDEATLTRVRSLSTGIAVGYLIFDLNNDPYLPERAADSGFNAINPWDPFVDGTLMERCSALGLEVNPWTVDDPIRIRQLAALGVDSIITNRPRAAREALSTH